MEFNCETCIWECKHPYKRICGHYYPIDNTYLDGINEIRYRRDLEIRQREYLDGIEIDERFNNSAWPDYPDGSPKTSRMESI